MEQPQKVRAQMVITIGKTLDPPNVLGKTITWGTPLASPIARDNISVRNPVVILNGYDIHPQNNYARVLWDGDPDYRYYFVTGIEKLTGNRTRLTLKIDVLETYKKYIGALSVVAERATSNVNRYIADSVQKTSARPMVQFKVFNGATPFISDSINNATRCIVVRAVAKEVKE